MDILLLSNNFIVAGWSSPVARRAHNPKVAGSNPVPAIIKKAKLRFRFFYCLNELRFICPHLTSVVSRIINMWITN